MKRKAIIFIIVLLSLSLSLPSAQAARKKAASSDDWEVLEQYVSDLQKNPGNEALRIKIINLVQEMKRPPAVPEEARRHYVTGKTYLGDAKKPEDFAAAVEEFKKALLVAPWWPEAYLDQARALKGADRYDEAASALKLFIATNPRGDLARKAQDEIYILEAKKKSGGMDLSNLLQNLDGGRWDSLAPGRQYPDFIKIEAKRFSLFSAFWDADHPAKCFTTIIESRSFEVPGYNPSDQKIIVKISEDGKEITLTRLSKFPVDNPRRDSEKFIRVK